MVEDLKSILGLHALRYPLMQPVDAVKLLYQRNFGGGHLVNDPGSSLERIVRELETMEDTGEEAVIPLGNGMVRVPLGCIRAGKLTAENLNALFVRSSEIYRGDNASFLHELGTLAEETKKGRMPFDVQALQTYLDAYAANHYPMVSHSSSYRAAYHPAYRVILEKLFPEGMDA
ncbi:MAG: hypothetical protein IJ708_02150 [Clostridia bacterium]|nr:hypothetical protein [Clostridia bacterium]